MAKFIKGKLKARLDKAVINVKMTLHPVKYTLLTAGYVHGIAKKVRRIRAAKEIRVLFLVPELGSWKTEELYLLMGKHHRFTPILGLFTSPPEAPKSRNQIEEYCKNKGYEYVDLDKTEMKSLKADIIFYQKPYPECYPEYMRPEHHPYALFNYVLYGFHGFNAWWSFNQGLFYYAWQIYYENQLLADEHRRFMPRRGRNIVVTGLPIQDQLNISPAAVDDPWKDHSGKKRIIYAPHHTIAGICMDGIDFGTFLDYSDFMLEMAEKYKDEVWIAFKPHPCLYKNLRSVWGEERVKVYYQKWANLENGQLETGAYTGLFMHSDAMIHDCGSFTIEYHYTHNPVLYLTKGEHHSDSLSRLSKRAYELHYKAQKRDDIERFIINVIKGIDPLKPQRDEFFEENLIPPYGKTACENIIHSILGEEEYK